jgi:hypothetical protein
MTDDPNQPSVRGVLREYRFKSQSPVVGPLIARLRAAWYNMAARWGDEAIINQQTAYNQAVAQQLAELDQRLILADHDLTNLTRTVAELAQQVIELRHVIEEAQAARAQS